MLYELSGLNFIDVTAGCVSIDRLRRDTAPIRCLPFDHIGARHQPVRTSISAGRQADFAPRFPPAELPTIRGSCRGYVVNFRG